MLARDLRGGGGEVMFRDGYLQMRPINKFIAGPVQGISITRRGDFSIRFDRGENKG